MILEETAKRPPEKKRSGGSGFRRRHSDQKCDLFGGKKYVWLQDLQTHNETGRVSARGCVLVHVRARGSGG
jgi:hypothetical protein